MASKLSTKQRRAARVRRSLKKVANGRPRLSIHRSNANIYAQIIDDSKGVTLVSVASTAKSFNAEGSKSEVSKKLGSALAEVAKEKGIETVVFDRNGFKYHGRVKALADAARDAGLKF